MSKKPMSWGCHISYSIFVQDKTEDTHSTVIILFADGNERHRDTASDTDGILYV